MEQFPDHVAEAAMHGVECVFSGASLEQLAEFMRKPLEFAAADGKPSVFLGSMKIVVKGGAQLAGYRGEGGRTLLDAAALGGCADIVSSLLRAGARPDLNVVSASSGRSALYLAASLGHEEAACCLARAGADVNFHDPVDRYDVLAKAADKGLGELVGLLLVGGADPTARTKNGDGYSPLHLAARSGSNRVVKALLEQGVIVDPRNSLQQPPLFMAAKAGHPVIVTTLLDAGADVMYCSGSESAFSKAASSGSIAVLEALFRACTPTQDMMRGAVYSAVECDRAVALDMFLEAGADCVNEGDMIYGSYTCLQWATMQSYVDIVRTLLRYGFPVNGKNEGWTCLQTAFLVQSEGLSEIVDVLLRNGADETETACIQIGYREKWVTPLQILEGCGLSVTLRDYVRKPLCSPEEKERARVLLTRAPNDRAWRRRSWLVMLRSQALKASAAEADAHGGTTKATKADQDAGVRDQAEGGNAGLGGVVVFLLGLSAEGVFRNVLGFL